MKWGIEPDLRIAVDWGIESAGYVPGTGISKSGNFGEFSSRTHSTLEPATPLPYPPAALASSQKTELACIPFWGPDILLARRFVGLVLLNEGLRREVIFPHTPEKGDILTCG